MDRQQRRQQIADYKQRDIHCGIYELHCTASDDRWAGTAMDLSTIANRLWFSLRQGNHPHRQLQAAWNQHGADAFQWRSVHALKEDEDRPVFERDRMLREALDQHCARTGASPLR